MTELLAASFAIGFLGSMHCIGMCGGLVTTLSMARRKLWWTGLNAYQLGRISTYMLLGLLAGILGVTLSHVPGFGQAQIVIAALAGMMMITFGLHIGGWLSDPFQRLMARFSTWTGLSTWLRAAATSSQPMSWYVVGLLNGLLPCGLVYAGLALSLTSGSLPLAAAMMAAFGLGTVPAMSAAPALLRRLAPAQRGHILKLAAVMLIGLGLLTMFRGSDWMSSVHDGMGHMPGQHDMPAHGSHMP